jgi:hypothetical protein
MIEAKSPVILSRINNKRKKIGIKKLSSAKQI